MQNAHDLSSSSLAAFSPETNAGKYLSRRAAALAEFEPDVPVCESNAIENAANCNALPLANAEPACPLPQECDGANVRYYCKRHTQKEGEERERKQEIDARLI